MQATAEPTKGRLDEREQPDVRRRQAFPPGELGRQACVQLEADLRAGQKLDRQATVERQRQRQVAEHFFLRPCSEQPRVGGTQGTYSAVKLDGSPVVTADRLISDRVAAKNCRPGKQQRQKLPGAVIGCRRRGKWTSTRPDCSAPGHSKAPITTRNAKRTEIGTLGTAPRFQGPHNPQFSNRKGTAKAAINFASRRPAKVATAGTQHAECAATVDGTQAAAGEIERMDFWRATDDRGRTPVHELCENPSATEAMLLFAGLHGAAGWLTRDLHGRSPLDYLVAGGRLWSKLVAGLVLVSSGVIAKATLRLAPTQQARTERRNCCGPLHWVCLRQNQLDAEAVRSLLHVDEPALATVASDGRNPLHWLCTHPHLLMNDSRFFANVVCRSLYFATAAVVQDSNGDTPLHLLCRHPSVSSAAVLAFVDRAPSATAVINQLGRLPLHYLAASSGVGAAALMAAAPQAAALATARDCDGTTPLEVLLANPTRTCSPTNANLHKAQPPLSGSQPDARAVASLQLRRIPAGADRSDPAWLRPRFYADDTGAGSAVTYLHGPEPAFVASQTACDATASPLHWLARTSVPSVNVGGGGGGRLDHAMFSKVLLADELALSQLAADGRTALHWLLKNPDSLRGKMFIDVVCESLYFAAAAGAPEKASGDTALHLLVRHPDVCPAAIKAFIDKAPLVAQMRNHHGLLPLDCMSHLHGTNSVVHNQYSGGSFAAQVQMERLLSSAGAELVKELRLCTQTELLRRCPKVNDSVLTGVEGVDSIPALDDKEKLIQWHVRAAAAAGAGVQ